MAGNSNSGRPRKPIADLLMGGTYRADRHSGAVDFDGVPIRPPGLDADAAQFWDMIVPHLVRAGVAKEPDSPMLGQMCVWWSRCRGLFDRLADGVFDDLDEEFRLQSMCERAWKQCSAIMCRYGLTPADRAKIRNAATQPDESDPFAALAGGRN